MMVPPTPPCLGLARVGGLICEQRPATLSGRTARRQNSARNVAQPLYRERQPGWISASHGKRLPLHTSPGQSLFYTFLTNSTLLFLPAGPASSKPQSPNQGLGLLHGPYLAWGPQLSSSGQAVLQGRMPDSFLECWFPLLPAWALSHFLLPLPCLSQTPLFGGQGGHGGARHPISWGSFCDWV